MRFFARLSNGCERAKRGKFMFSIGLENDEFITRDDSGNIIFRASTQEAALTWVRAQMAEIAKEREARNQYDRVTRKARKRLKANGTKVLGTKVP